MCDKITYSNGVFFCVTEEIRDANCVPESTVITKTKPQTFLNFYGQQTQPVLTAVFNKDEQVVKILQSLSLDLNGAKMYIDLVYSTQNYGFSYIPTNLFIEKEKMIYAAFLRDMVSYLDSPSSNDFRSTLQDGKRIFGEYFVVRFIQDNNTLGKYFELNAIDYLYTSSTPTKP
jgi:hypothetical protein